MHAVNEGVGQMQLSRLDGAFNVGMHPAPAVVQASQSIGARVMSIEPVLRDDIRRRHPFFRPVIIPRGTYAGQSEDVTTLGVDNLLVCRDELPALQAWYAAHQTDDSVVMVGIPRDDSSSAIRDAARRDHMGWAVQNDRGAQAATLAYATRGQPESFVISPTGIVVGSIIGPMRTQDLDRMARVGKGV